MKAGPERKLIEEVVLEKASKKNVVMTDRCPPRGPQGVWGHSGIIHAGAGIGHVVDSVVCLLLDFGAMVCSLVRQGLVQPRGQIRIVSAVKQWHHVSKIGQGELVSRVRDQHELEAEAAILEEA